MINQEVEWQFDTSDLDAPERWLIARPTDSGVAVSPLHTELLIDTYYDTADWRCHRAGFAFRIRQHDDSIEATLKSFKSVTQIPGLRSRQEITQEINLPNLKDLEKFKHAKGAVSDRLRWVAGGDVLRPLFDVQTRRRSFELLFNGKAAGEVTLDETVVRSGKQQATLTRVEVEVPPLLVDTVQAFVDEFREACQLTPATQSKFGTGMALGKHVPSFAPDLGETKIDSESLLSDVAYSVLRQQFGNVLKHEPAVLLDDEVEAIHDMRVATRRLRTALKLFTPYLPARILVWRAELSWVAELLGTVRDLDVQLIQMRAWVSDAALTQLLTKEREQAWKKLVRGLTSPRYAKLVKLFSAGLRRGITNQVAPKVRAVEAAPPLLKKGFKKLRESAESLTPESLPIDYHALRIRGKHFRYTVEFFSALYADTPELLKRLVALQDVLGALQDTEVALPRLATLREEHGAVLTPPTLWALGELAERYSTQAVELRRQVPRTFKKLRKRWKVWRKNLWSDSDETIDRAAR